MHPHQQQTRREEKVLDIVSMIHPQISLFREMELRRRKKEEEKLSTERKIREVQVKILLLPRFYIIIILQKSIQSAENWKKQKEYWQETVMPFCVGVVMFVAGGYFFFRHVRS